MPPDHQPVICCDFDNTICESGPPDWTPGEPILPVIEALRVLREREWWIVIHSCRVNSQWPEPEREEKTQVMIDFLRTRHVPVDAIWGVQIAGPIDCFQAPVLAWDFDAGCVGKPLADVYLDDRAVSVLAWACGAYGTPASICHNRQYPPSAEQLVEQCEEVAKRNASS